MDGNAVNSALEVHEAVTFVYTAADNGFAEREFAVRHEGCCQHL
jgi:hypothetical protein